MCGICGIYNFNKEKRADQATIKRMCDILKHRGPDDEGYYFSENIGLGHRRLSVIDIEGGHQPMSNEDNTIWIIQNGEIYNYLELRNKLVSEGHTFKTRSDTEVILHLYEKLGFDCVDELNGMFAFAIWDARKRILFLARDRLGIKPLYYYIDNEKLIFASEIKAILEESSLKAKVNQEGLRDYLTFQFCLGEKTLFKDIKKLLPGHKIIISNKKIKIKKYWDLDFTIDTQHKKDYFVDKLKMLIEGAVRLRLRSDVPIGVHLSGGIDSTTVCCIASSLCNNQLKTFTGGFNDGKAFNETHYARVVSKFSQTSYHEVFPTPSDFIKNFNRMIYFLDEPAAGPGVFPQYFVSRLAKQNVKVVLGGQGGDEIFGGYSRYLIAYFEECIRGAIFGTQERAEFVATFESILPNLPQLVGYEPLLQYFWQEGLFEDMDRRYFRLIRKDVGIKDLISRKAFNTNGDYHPLKTFQGLFNRPGLSSLVNKMLNFDMKTLLPALLQVEDRTSMAASLESRVPLLDHRIAELAASLPPVIKYKGGQAKYILKQAVKNIIPKEILDRKDKMGFPVPLSQWYKGPLKNFVKDILLDDKTRKRGIFKTANIEKYLATERRYGRKIWGLLCLEVWFRTFID